MKKKILLEYASNGAKCRWLEYLEVGSPVLPAHMGSLDDFFAAFESSAKPDLLLVLNSTDVNVRTLSFEPEERRHILKTARFELEESLVSDVEDVHFAFGKPGEDAIAVAIIERELLRILLEQFTDNGFELVGVVPYSQVLEPTDDRWIASATDTNITVRLNQSTSFTTSYQQARLAWDVAARSENLPSRITLFEDSKEAAEQAADTMPLALTSIVTAERKPWFVASNWSALKQGSIDLLQGEFSPSIAWRKIWTYWQMPAILFAAGLTVFTVAAFLENRALHAENLSLRQQSLAAYQQEFPNSQVSNPEQQMREQLKKYSATGETSKFLPLFYASAQALDKFHGVNVLNVNFDSRNNELRVDLVAKQYQDIEKIRESLGGAGVNAELLSSNSIETGERARMKFSQR